MPGLIAFGISKILSGAKSRPVNEIVIDLVLQTVFVFVFYYLVSQNGYFGLPKVSELIAESFRARAEKDTVKIDLYIETFERAFYAALVIAFITGIVSAFCKELKVIRRIGRCVWLFQSDAEESAWKTVFEIGSRDCWVQVDTKGDVRYLGTTLSVSWDYADGGIGLENVFMASGTELIPVAGYIYIPNQELNGPVLFIEGKPKEKEIDEQRQEEPATSADQNQEQH